ncbi:hypothetical protein P154DRAFT_520394 [Amniculicola lignicola CBS 123094]|uniref:Uncharacterized protein n=1 Tax=Amniculicola lignicola CBS 123094 TaxID=1392246 RepID=A0A6A5WM29_9PLEO|nr:hypothetical protein P154DRAFT_520394 [Amniculicola lignicola CBS 123094]
MSSTAPNPFAVALESFISDLKRAEDIRSPFYKEVLAQISSKAPNKTLADQNTENAEKFQRFVEELGQRQKRNSKTLWISEKLRPLVSGLSQYTAACDVMIQAAPDAASLIYGGARIVLMSAERFSNCFETVVAMMEDIGKLLGCYHLFSKAYQTSADMQRLLVETYKNIITFWQKASKLFSRKVFKTLLSGIVKPLDAEWQRCRQALEEDSRRVQLFAQATEADMRRQKDEEKVANQQAKLRAQIVEWIKGCQEDDKLDFRRDIRDYLDVRHENTGDWLFQHPDMERWLASKKTTSIWYNASPGSGKTILTSTLVRRLQDRGLRTAVFFCSFNDLERKKAVSVLRSIALQLLGPTDSIPQEVKRLYEDDIMHHCSRLVDLKVCVRVVETLMKQLGRIHIIIDGIDECEDKGNLLIALGQLLRAKSYGIVKWFFTSRAESDIRAVMAKEGVREIEAPQNNLMDDIRTYVASRVHDQCNPCIDYWTKESEGNFLWVYHMLAIVDGEGTTCDEEIDEELNRFPKGLTGCYARCLSRILKRPEKHQQLARLIFTMIVGAVQPMHLSELKHALAAAKGSDDYSPKALPKAELIEELCSNLVTFDRITKGTENDPLLKVAHKSVQDFFLQDPDDLELPDEKIRSFFVTTEKANLVLGRSALSYLSYLRYSEAQDVSLIVEQDDHAFLRHAAAFWHRYLTDASLSKDLNEQVLGFVRSEALWTCIAVQSLIAPHLFAQYRRFLCGYNYQSTGPKDEEDDDSVCYAFPLPVWLDQDQYGPSGPQIVEAVHSFVTEWHAVLTSYPNAISECIMDSSWDSVIPGRAVWQSNRGKLIALSDGVLSPTLTPVSVIDLEIREEFIVATVLACGSSTGKYHTMWLQLHAASGKITMMEAKKHSQLISGGSGAHSQIILPMEDGDQRYWQIDTKRLTAQRSDLGLVNDTANPPEVFRPDHSDAGEWRLHSKSISSVSEGGSKLPVVAYHCSQHISLLNGSQLSREDSGYGSIASDSDYESGTEDSSSDVEPVTKQCMLIIRGDKPPIWHYWKSHTKSTLESKPTFHPTNNTAIWSQQPHQLSIINLESGAVTSTILPEPVDAQFSSICAAHKEFHFSPSGTTLHYLLYTALETTHGTRHTISLSSFDFSTTQEAECRLERTQPTKTVMYECAGLPQHPLILTFWDTTHIYIALPPLSCNAKIVRLRIPSGDYNNGKDIKGDIETLTAPIYLPYSTPYRNPELHVLESSQQQILAITLDAELAPLSGISFAHPTITKPPSVLSWPIASKGEWRVWDLDGDGRSKEVVENECTFAKLRGSFVDADKRFEVQIRSGLDWRRKAFLSCA